MVAATLSPKVCGFESARDLWNRTALVEVLARLEVEAAITDMPYGDLADLPEPEWEVLCTVVEWKLPRCLCAVETLVLDAGVRTRRKLVTMLRGRKGIRIDPDHAFRMTPFAAVSISHCPPWTVLPEGMWRACIWLKFQQLPIADVVRFYRRDHDGLWRAYSTKGLDARDK